MKTIKIYSFPSHQTTERTSGVDYVRNLLPMKYLNGYKDDVVEFQVTFFDINQTDKPSWVEIAKEHDLVFLNYIPLDWEYAAMGMCVHGEGKKIIMDIDDAIWYVQKDNIVHDQLKEMDAEYVVTCILNDVDGVMTTNRYLRNIIVDKTMKYHDKVKIAENMIDLTLYDKTFPAKDTGTITLMHYGSSSHFDDLLDPDFIEGVDMIMKEYPQVVFKAVHSFIPELRYRWGVRYQNASGIPDIYDWVKYGFPPFMEEADIMVVPLRDTKYNRAKSDIKFIETASAMKPAVFSNTRPYTDTIEHGKTGYLVKSKQEWYEALKQLVESKEKRQEIGENAYNFVKENRQIQSNLQPYIDFFKKIVLGG